MSKKILIVDDEARVAISLAEVLTDLEDGYKIKTATSEKEALDHLTNQAYDLIVTDLQMPGEKGFQLVREARTRAPHALIILMTAWWNEKVSETAKSLGVYRCLSKPFSRQKLVSTVQSALGKRTEPELLTTGFAKRSLQKITQCLEGLQTKVDAKCVLLANTSGHLLARIGELEGYDENIISLLFGASFATSTELHSFLGNKDAFSLQYHECDNWEIYSANVDVEHLIILVLERQDQANPIGLVLLDTRRTLEELSGLLRDAGRKKTSQIINSAFLEEFNNSLDKFFPEIEREDSRGKKAGKPSKSVDRELPPEATIPHAHSAENLPSSLSAPAIPHPPFKVFSYEQAKKMGFLKGPITGPLGLKE